jgi:hypothetical protein
MMMAFSVLASAPLVIALHFLQRYVVQGMTAGAIRSHDRLPLADRPIDAVGLRTNALDLIAIIDGYPQPDTKSSSRPPTSRGRRGHRHGRLRAWA